MCTVVFVKDQYIRTLGDLSALVGKELIDKYHDGEWTEDRCLCGIRDTEDLAREVGYAQFTYMGDVQWVTQKHILDILTNIDIEKFTTWTNVDRRTLWAGQFEPAPRVLFLDIDGVLNTTDMSGAANGPTPIDPQAIQRLNQLLDEFEDLRIVVSSAHRIGVSLEGLRKLLSGLPPERIIDSTPVITSMRAQRGDEIQQWLNGHPEVTACAILDDNNDMAEMHYYLVRTSAQEGLQDEHIIKCRELLTI